MVRVIYKNWGFVFERQFDSLVPLWYLFFGTKYSISYHYFHSGIGLHILLPGINLMIATKGQIAWWLKPGKGMIRILNFKKEW